LALKPLYITDIVPDRKKKGIYRVFTDGDYSFSLHAELLVRYGLKQGKTIEDPGKLDSEESFLSAYDYALLLLDYGNRSEKEIEQRLLRKKYGSETISRVSEKLKYLGLLNDEKLAERWTENRLRSGIGVNLIRQELYKKGVAGDTVKKTLETLKPTPEQEYKSAKVLFQKKIKGCRNLPPEKVYPRVSSYLARRGFSPGTINKLFRDWKKEFSEISLETD
jgi:regulatory protein